jgi:hypothetical protein
MMKALFILLLTASAAMAVPTGTVTRSISVFTNTGLLVDTNFLSVNGIATSQQVANASAQAVSGLASAAVAQASADAAIKWGDAATTNAATPLFWGIAGDNSGIAVMMYGWYPGSFGDVQLRPLFSTSVSTNMLDYYYDSMQQVSCFSRAAASGAQYRLYDTQWPPTATEVGASSTNHTHTAGELIGAAWHTNTVVTLVETNELGAVTNVISATLIYLGAP